MTSSDIRKNMMGTSSVVKLLIGALAAPIAEGMVISSPPNTGVTQLSAGEYEQSILKKEVRLAMRDVGEMGV